MEQVNKVEITKLTEKLKADEDELGELQTELRQVHQLEEAQKEKIVRLEKLDEAQKEKLAGLEKLEEAQKEKIVRLEKLEEVQKEKVARLEAKLIATGSVAAAQMKKASLLKDDSDALLEGLSNMKVSIADFESSDHHLKGGASESESGKVASEPFEELVAMMTRAQENVKTAQEEISILKQEIAEIRSSRNEITVNLNRVKISAENAEQAHKAEITKLAEKLKAGEDELGKLKPELEKLKACEDEVKAVRKEAVHAHLKVMLGVRVQEGIVTVRIKRDEG